MAKIKVTPKSRSASQPDADHSNREAYLIAAIDILRPFFETIGYQLPHVRVSVGWPGGRGGLKKLGSCWARAASKDGAFQIFVSPVVEDSIQALSTLIHELCHAVTDCNGHSHEFGNVARSLGLEGKLTATYPGNELTDRLNALVVDKLGKYPHAALTPEKSGEKKQGTRMVKCVCKDTGYTVRTTRAWLVKYGPPLSPSTKEPMTVEGVEAEQKEDAA